MKFLLIVTVALIFHMCQFANVEAHCRKAFKRSRMLAKCCSLPSIIGDDIRAECTQPFNEMDYVFPSLHKRHHRHHHHHHRSKNTFNCFMECAFNATGAVSNGELNLDNLNDYLETIDVPEDLVPIIKQSFEQCNTRNYAYGRRHHHQFEGRQSSFMPDDIGTMPPCNAHSGRLMRCVLFNVVQNCPSDLQIDSEECNRLREYNDANCSQSASDESNWEVQNVNDMQVL